MASPTTQYNNNAGGDLDNNGDHKDAPPSDPNAVFYPSCYICGTTFALQDPLTPECGDYHRGGMEGKITLQDCPDFRQMLVGEC